MFENHDNPRTLNRYADGKRNVPVAKLLATVLLTPRCASLMYYGEELGMMDNDPKRKEDVKDPVGKAGLAEGQGARRRTHANAVE